MNFSHMPCACTIAGSDSGGGAGIQADLKTFAALGVWGCSVITAVTAQNPESVKGIWNMNNSAVACQMEAVMEDFNISAFKCGMLPSSDVIKVVSDCLPDDVPFVLDPVIVSTSGKALSDDSAFNALKNFLVSKSTLITPNIPESCALSGFDRIEDTEDLIAAGKIILDMGAGNVLLKGGHMGGKVSEDLLLSKSGIIRFSAERMPYDVHGSGCSLSSAVTAGLSKGLCIEDACREAKIFINSAIKHAFISKSGRHSINPLPINLFLSNNNNYIPKNQN